MVNTGIQSQSYELPNVEARLPSKSFTDDYQSDTIAYDLSITVGFHIIVDCN